MNQHIIRRIACILVLVILACAMPFSANAAGNVVIVLDPGHGGSDPGSVATYSGVEYLESDLVWKIANYCKDYLQTQYTGVTVYLTRAEDETLDLEDRVDFGISVNADFLLSIHLNVYADGTARGATALVPAGTYNPGQAEISQAVGTAILSKLESLGLKNRGLYTHTLKQTFYPNGGGADSYYLLRYGVTTNLPTIIMEQCFIDDAQDFQNVLSSDEKLKALGEANAIALAEYFELEALTDVPVVNNEENTEPSTEPVENTEEVPPETTGEVPPETTAPTVGDGKKSSGLVSVLKVIGIVLLLWFLVKCYQFHQFRKRQEEKRRRAKARAAARRRAQQAQQASRNGAYPGSQRTQQVNRDGTYPRSQREMTRSEYERQYRSPQRGNPQRSRSRSDHRNNYIQ